MNSTPFPKLPAPLPMGRELGYRLATTNAVYLMLLARLGVKTGEMYPTTVLDIV